MSSAKSFHETFYGTPTEDESRRRRGKKRHNKAAKEEPQNEVAVIGVHYRSFDDDSLAAFVNSATALVPWNGDPKLLIDRYDVRHLLQDLTGIRRRRARPPSPDATKEELDYERYRDVEGLENPSPPEDELRNEDVTGGGYQRVGFDYGTSGDQETRKERVEDALFSAPFFVPEHLRLQIPTSTKVHQIMAGTAKYVIEHGGQAEIVLRVKQANNPTFGFLMPDHHDHEYFRFLVAHPEHVGIGPTSQQAAVAEVAAPVSSEEAEGGLSLLGTAYGDADEDEEEGEGSEAYKDQAEELLVVATGDLEEVGTVTKLHIEGSSDHGAARKKSSTINLTTSDVAENATKDRGDSLEVSLGSDVPKSVLQSGEGPVDGLVDSSPGSGDQVPQGREACSSGSGEMEGHEGQGYSGDLDHQVVPPYKEPPLRLRLIINKMVEFISRNGKEFEAIVKERDKADHRFPFFLPWNEYHPYYAKELESARQARLSAETDSTGIPSTIDPLNPLQGQEAAEKDEGAESFLNGVPFWDTSQAVESNCVNGEEISNMPEYEEEKSHNDEGGMGFDAVLAAVRFATRGRLQPVDGNHESDLPKISDGDERPGIGSDEAVLAAIRAATGRTKLDSSGSVGKKDVPNVAGSNAPDVKEARDPAQTSTVSRGAALGDTKDPIQTSTLSRNTSVGDSSDPIGTATSLPQSTAEAIINLDEDHVVVPHLVTKAGVLSPVEERDSVEPQLTTPEKRKAERLKKAKLFAAMIKDKKGSLTNPVQLSGSVGISAPNLDRLNQVFVALESTADNVPAASIDAEPETRDQTGDTQVQVATEADKELADSPVKQRKHKAKSKEEEERRRKHRHKRRKDMEEGGNGRVHSPGTGERREDKHHDHYQDSKRKESKYGPEAEGRAKDNKRGLSEGKPRVDEGFQDLEDRTEEYEEARKDRVHYTKDSERRKESRYGYEAEQKKRRDRHTQDSEGTRKESRHERDAEDERREDRQKHDKSRHGYASEDERRVDRHTHNKTRHGYDSEEGRREDRKKHDISRHGYDSEEGRREDRKKHDISRHEYDSEEERRGDRQKPDRIRRGYDFEEERRGDRQKEDTDRKRKDRSGHDSEEKRSGDRYEYDSDGMRKGRSHRQGKRKKHSDRTDVSDDKDGRRNDYRTKKSRQHTDDFESATLATHVERQSTHLREVKDDRKLGVVSPLKQDVPSQTNVSQMRVGEEKSTLSSADVPDDIRAKVRAMLAMM